ncbi:hypothetical protein SAMN04487996_10413 [Dyadobacter soli]|uniref:Uncharacterized protein n=1 Tax=Dyadobacter soli TaxID=659014 RepID=A0A1G7AYL0_9BACT|nr:hypothetical protein [Dyadobacter soli]SDE19851.1 hypothetical protein SAMN04487996_10413 [Dyadobacter soli]
MNAGAVPIRLRLSYWESLGLKKFLEPICQTKVGPETRNETIVLIEFAEKFYGKCFGHGLNRSDKVATYQIPISVARIIHYRLQCQPTNAALQQILWLLDQHLTNRGLKPEFEKTLAILGH